AVGSRGDVRSRCGLTTELSTSSRSARRRRKEPMVQRQIPRPAEILELMTFKPIDLDGKRRRLSSALTIEDLRTIAKRRTPAAAFDYTDGAAEGEISMDRSVEAFEDIEFHPPLLHDVTPGDTTAQHPRRRPAPP